MHLLFDFGLHLSLNCGSMVTLVCKNLKTVAVCLSRNLDELMIKQTGAGTETGLRLQVF